MDILQITSDTLDDYCKRTGKDSKKYRLSYFEIGMTKSPKINIIDIFMQQLNNLEHTEAVIEYHHGTSKSEENGNEIEYVRGFRLIPIH